MLTATSTVFEAYLLAASDEERRAVLDGLVEGSEAWYEFEILKMLRSGRTLAHRDLQVLLDRHQKTFGGEPQRQLRLRSLLVSIAQEPEGSEVQREHLSSLARKELGLQLEHVSPAQGSRGGPGGGSASTSPSELPAGTLHSEAQMLQKLYDGRFACLPACHFKNVDLEKLASNDTLERFLTQCVRGEEMPLLAGNVSLLPGLVSFLRRRKEKNPTCEAPGSVLALLTLGQLEELGTEVPQLRADYNYVEALLRRRFREVLNDQAMALFSREQRRERLRDMLAFVDGFKRTPLADADSNPPVDTLPRMGPEVPGMVSVQRDSLGGLRARLLSELLQLGVLLADLDAALLLRYLKEQPEARRSAANCAVLPAASCDAKALGLGRPVTEQPPVRAHLRRFILDEGFVDKLRTLLSSELGDRGASKFLGQFRDETALLAGKPLGHSDIQAEWQQKITERVQLEILPHTKEEFAPDEEVRIALRLKNVPRLAIRIYEINAENYYVENQHRFQTNIDLEGVCATSEFELSYEYPAIREHDEELTLPQIPKRPALFVIDFVGNGVRSRAVLRKGSLSLIHKPSPAGHVAFVLGPNREVVVQGARLFLGGRWWEGNAEKGGRIVVPYGARRETVQVVISALGTAQFSDFVREAESYQLQVGFCLLPESVIMGQKAKLLMRPRLLCCGRHCDLNLLKKAEVKIIMHAGNIPSVRTFSGFKWAAGDPHVEFLVPPRLKSIEAHFTVEVENHSQKKTEKLSQNRTWTVEDHTEDEHTCYELYLTGAPTGTGWAVWCLGKDGEPQPDVLCTLHFEDGMDAMLGQASTTLMTDKNGLLTLGKLKDVDAFTVKAGNLERRWELPREQGMQYPEHIDLLEGEEACLPFTGTELEPHSSCLVELGNAGEPVALRRDALSLRVDDGSLSSLVIRGLTRGTYHLIIAGEQRVRLEVHRGSKWQNEYVLRHDAIVENRESRTSVRIAKANTRPGGISLQLTNFGRRARVHAFGFRFFPPNLLELVQSLQHASRESFTSATFPFQRWHNLFQSNVKLGDECSYVLRRQKSTANVGNLAKKPRLLMHPRAVRDTSFSSENLASSEQFRDDSEIMPRMAQMSRAAPMMQAPMPMGIMQQQMPMAMREQARMPAARQGKAQVKAKKARGRRGEGRPLCDIQGFQNFLKGEALVATNIIPTNAGNVELEADTRGFSCVLLVATDEGSVAHQLLSLAESERSLPACRGLALETPQDANKAFIERRAAEPLEVGGSVDLADQTSAEWRAVDSVERLLAFYGAVTPSAAAVFNEWGCGEWGSLSRDVKIERWSKNACHELHLFIRHKDAPFFAEVVQPFLKVKMEKDVVDWYLLGDTASLTPLLSPARFQALNPLEQVLVLRALSTVEADVCRKIASIIVSKADSLEQAEVARRRNNLLDSVLSLEASKTDDWCAVDDVGGAWGCDEVGGGAGGAWACDEEVEECFGGSDGSFGSARGGSRAMCFAAAAPAPPPPGAPMMNMNFDMSAEQVTEVVAAHAPEPWKEPLGTKEFAETYYHEGDLAVQCPSGAAQLFWADVARHAVGLGSQVHLLTPNFIFASSVLDVAGALALLDLPLAPSEHNLVSLEGLKASFLAQSPCIFVAKETVTAPPPTEGVARDVQVSVRIFKARDDETESQDPRAVAEFLPSEPYCLQVILTNVSPKQLDCQLMVQVPQGALPLGSAAYSRAIPQRLGAFACCRVVVPLYFPRPGDFIGSPVCCAVNGEVIATSGSVRYHVVQTPSKADVRTFADVIRAGEDAIISFLRERNLFQGELHFDFAQLYPHLGSERLYRGAVTALRDRGIFERTVWGYGFKHGDINACRELLASEKQLHKRLGPFFECLLVSVSASQAGFRHLDYYPLVNKRAHRLKECGALQPILNQQLKETYETFLRALAWKPALDGVDRLRLSYYLLCQERVEEARALFEASGGAAGDDERLQRDYMAAYFDLFEGADGLVTARRVAREHAGCPHLEWRKRFVELAQILAEVDGATAEGGVGEGITSGPEAAPALSAELRAGSTVEIQAEGVKEIIVRLYKINLEMLFSLTPFMRDVRPDFSFVKPVYETVIPGATRSWKIPDEYRQTDLTVELAADSLKTFNMYFASALRVAVAEQHGYLKASSEDGKPLAAVYVKVFAKQGSREYFFKDGYTDIRGRFDYASLSGETSAEVDRFAILVVATDAGGLVREAQPPAGLKRRR